MEFVTERHHGRGGDFTGDEFLDDDRREEREPDEPRDHEFAQAQFFGDRDVRLALSARVEFRDTSSAPDAHQYRHALRRERRSVFIGRHEDAPLVRGAEVAVEMDEIIAVLEFSDGHAVHFRFLSNHCRSRREAAIFPSVWRSRRL